MPGPHIFAPMDPPVTTSVLPRAAPHRQIAFRGGASGTGSGTFFRSPGKSVVPQKIIRHLRSLGVKYHNGLQQPPGVLILGLADAADGQIFSYTALIKEQHIVTEISDRGQVVGDKYIGQSQFFLQSCSRSITWTWVCASKEEIASSKRMTSGLQATALAMHTR